MSDTIQYTIRGITPAADARLKAQAKKQGISLNKFLLQKLDALPNKTTKPKVYHDLDEFIASITPEDKADAEQAWQVIKADRIEARQRAQAEYEAEKTRDEWA